MIRLYEQFSRREEDERKAREIYGRPGLRRAYLDDYKSRVKVASVKAKELMTERYRQSSAAARRGKFLDNTHPVSLSAPPRQESVWT